MYKLGVIKIRANRITIVNVLFLILLFLERTASKTILWVTTNIHYKVGIRTLSIIWITPFDARLLAFVTLELVFNVTPLVISTAIVCPLFNVGTFPFVN